MIVDLVDLGDNLKPFVCKWVFNQKMIQEVMLNVSKPGSRKGFSMYYDMFARF